MSLVLIVVNAFDSFAKGDQISDSKAISDVLASDVSVNVIRANIPDVPSRKLSKDASE